MGDRKLLAELRERIAAIEQTKQAITADDVMDVLADYEVTRRPKNAINMVISQPAQQPQGFSRWNLEEAYQEGVQRGRRGR